MSQKKAEKSSDSGSVLSIEAFNSVLDNINQNSDLNQINKKIDEEQISSVKAFDYNSDSPKKPYSILMIILCRILDSIFFLIVVIVFILFIISTILLVFEIGISFYSVLMMNYIFFVSSIVSYSMAPIYQSLSSDWINFTFSFTQVILASPLITFYLFYITKSVVSLASFISDIPKVIVSIFTALLPLYKEFFIEFIAHYTDRDVKFIFGSNRRCITSALFGISLACIILTSGLAYAEFCLDKTIILLGSICYIANTIQIIILILPSYLYFFQTLANAKCKEIKFVKKYITLLDDLLEAFPDESESEESSEKELKQISSTDSDSYDSDSILDNVNKKINHINTKNDKDEKFIDDPYIEKFVDDDEKALNKFGSLIHLLLQLITAKSYFSLYYYSTSIAFDKHKKCRKIVFMYIFFILNLAVISYDIYQLTQNYSSYFLASVIIRFLIIPLLSYYNILSIIFQRSKDISLNIVLIVSSVLTVVIAIIIIVCFKFTDFYQNKYRINDLNYIPQLNNYTPTDYKMTNHPICEFKVFDVSAFDAFGYSLGGYDVKRNKTVFDNQMKFFFDENYSSHITYTVHELDKHFLFIEYYDSLIDTHIFAFRGYNSGPEVAFQLELLAIHYIIPFFEDIVPFYELINDYWLEFYTDFLTSFGLQFFENNNLMVNYVNSIVEIYKEKNFKEDDRIVFAGVNCGGAFAKILGTILHRKSISFLSFPIDNDIFNTLFDFSPSYISLVTNVYNIDGFFSDQEPRYAINIGIDMPVFDQTKFCTSGICEINSKTDNVYRTFCTMSEMCAKGNRFEYYCKNIIGKDDFETIRENLKDND